MFASLGQDVQGEFIWFSFKRKFQVVNISNL